MKQQEASDLFMSKAQIREEFDLNDHLIAQMGEPDTTKVNPHFRCAEPMKLYRRARVVQFLHDNAEAVQKLHDRQQQRRRGGARPLSPREKREQFQAACLERVAREEQRFIAQQVTRFKIAEVPNREQLVKEVQDFYGRSSAEAVTERAICSYVRHHYSNYEQILRLLRKQCETGSWEREEALGLRVGLPECFPGHVAAAREMEDQALTHPLYQAFKMMVCCQVIKRCGLHLHPLSAAYGALVPRLEHKLRFSLEDDLGQVESKARELLGLKSADPAKQDNALTAQTVSPGGS